MADQSNITFIFKLQNSDATLLNHKAAVVTPANAQLFIVSASGPVAEQGNFTSESQSLDITFQCESFGEATFQIEIPFVDHTFDSIKFGARKLCGGTSR